MTNPSVKTGLLALGLAVAALLGAGCQTSEVSLQPDEPARYTSGSYYSLLPSSLQETLQAFLLAVEEDPEIRLASYRYARTFATLEAVLPDDRRVFVEMRPRENGRTQVRVRAGAFGDRITSEQIVSQASEALLLAETDPAE